MLGGRPLTPKRRVSPALRVPLQTAFQRGYDPIGRPLHVSDCAGRSSSGLRSCTSATNHGSSTTGGSSSALGSATNGDGSTGWNVSSATTGSSTTGSSSATNGCSAYGCSAT